MLNLIKQILKEPLLITGVALFIFPKVGLANLSFYSDGFGLHPK